MHVAFRTEGGKRAGLGHLRRCLSLAQALRSMGAECSFLLNGDSALSQILETQGFEYVCMTDAPEIESTLNYVSRQMANAVVVDSYELGSDYFATLMNSHVMTVALDDNADRALPVSIVVNPAPNADSLSYQTRPDTLRLLGPSYALLRSEFGEVPSRLVDGPVRRTLVTVGGSDPSDLTSRLLDWTARALPGAVVDVISGPFFTRSNGHGWSTSSEREVNVYHDPVDVRALMLRADLILCAGGQTLYEVAATAGSAIAIRTADNQTLNLESFALAGAVMWVGDSCDPDLGQRVMSTLTGLSNDPERRKRLGEQGRGLVDGQGARRVARAIVQRSGEAIQ